MIRSPYDELFAQHRSAGIPTLFPWQSEVLTAFAAVSGDAAVELPTGTGKTLIGLLAGELFRQNENMPVAYLAGNKQLAQQVERHARELGFPAVRFQGPKDGWDHKDVRAFNFAQSIGVMNYWNYFNANPGIEPAGMLILDDVHLLEGPLRDMFTVSVARSDPLCAEILRRIVARCPYYQLADDLLSQVDVVRPPEMLVFPDSADLAEEVRALLDARLLDGSSNWWAWQAIRERLDVCCWLVSMRGLTFTPYIPPTQTIAHFKQPSRRLYMSATVGSVEDLQRRLGTPPLEKLSASVQPRQGERLVVIRDGTELPTATELLDELRPFLEHERKALWLCARAETAKLFELALNLAALPGTVRRLDGDNEADEPFAAESNGHLVAAGRYDGMDFPGDACRLEIVPEVPVATSDLEEFVSSSLRDAAFAEARFAQRVAQALGRCNRQEDDRAVYLLTDPAFLGRFSQRRVLDSLPDDVRADVYSGVERADDGLAAGLREAEGFLGGTTVETRQPPRRQPLPESTTTAADEVNGILALWRHDYAPAAVLFDRIAQALTQTREHRAFWLAMRALALKRMASLGDRAAETQGRAALRAAASTGALQTFFTRLRLSEARVRGEQPVPYGEGLDGLFAAWDRLLDRHGAVGPQLDRWSARLVDDLRSSDHDTVARAIAEVGVDLLGLAAGAPKPDGGAEDAFWELTEPRRVLTFEVKLGPQVERIVNDDVEQAEGAAKAAETSRGAKARGILVTPHRDVDDSASARLERVRLMGRETLVGQVERVIDSLREYRRGWDNDANVRAQRRDAVAPDLPRLDWIWSSVEMTIDWIESDVLERAREASTQTSQA